MPSQKWAWVAATLDTKIDEALYVCSLLEAAGLPVRLIDLSTKEISSDPTKVRQPAPTLLLTSASQIAAHHPKGASAVFWRSGDRRCSDDRRV